MTAELRPAKGNFTIIRCNTTKNRRLSEHKNEFSSEHILPVMSYARNNETKEIQTQYERVGKHKPQSCQVLIGELSIARARVLQHDCD